MTLIELLISIGVVMVGMLGMLRVLSAAVEGSVSAQRFSQGQTRAQEVIEAMRTAPLATLQCLVQGTASWAGCESSCKAALGVNASSQACVFITLANLDAQNQDTTNTQYQVVTDTTDQTRSSFVAVGGTSARIYDLQVTVGWNDDGTNAAPTHRVTMHSAVFR
jgi:Tfp pilus assembly protein PilV